MKVSRRDFFKLIATAGVALAIETYKSEIAEALDQVSSGERHVIWLQGAGCTGCTISLLQSAHPDLVEAITRFRLSIDFHPTIMIEAGEEAIDKLIEAIVGKEPLDILIVEGAVPKDYYCMVGELNGKPVPFEYWVKRLGSVAKNVVAVGTCASFGGIPHGNPNPTGARPVSEVLPTKTVINLPGCPAHPDWMLVTIFSVLKGYKLELDELNRPKLFYGIKIHDHCPRRQYFDNGIFAEEFGESGCLVRLGCRGPITPTDCPYRRWNNGVSWCIGDNAPCVGCCHPSFPDPPTSPFYNELVPVELPPPPKKPAGIDPRILAGIFGGIAAVGAAAAYKSAETLEEKKSK